MVAERAQKGLNVPTTSASFNKLHHDNPYNEATNKTGYIKLTSADNTLCSDLINAKFSSIDWEKFDKNLLYEYPRAGGELATLTSAAAFINRYCRKELPPLMPEEELNDTKFNMDLLGICQEASKRTIMLSILPGVTSGLDLLSQVLFDPGDFILSPAPYYYRFLNDFGDRGLVHIQLVQSLCEDGVCAAELPVERFELAYQEAQSKMGKVRAIILVNPQNPEGCYFTLAEIRPIVEWALERNLFIILDEIYDLSIYDEEPGFPFKSAIQLFQTPESKEKLIWLWGLSKNFSLPGIRAAFIYTPNVTVRTAVRRFMMHHQPNCMTQFMMRQFLDDYDWFENIYFPENMRRLRQTRDRVLAVLDELGIKYLKPRAGFFVLADFSKYMKKLTLEEERALSQKFIQKKVLLTPGEIIKAPKPGWFRIVFTCVDAATLEEGMKRIREAIVETANKES